MKANIDDLKVVKSIPEFYNGTDAYHKSKTHYEDGWRDVIKPEITSKQKRGEVYYDEENDVITYEIIDKSDTEIENETRKAIRSIYQRAHEIKGNDIYQEFRVDLIIALQKGDIDNNKLFEIEDLLEPVYSRLKNGNWKTALFIINQIETEDPVLLSYKNEALEDIQDYINNNY